MHQSHGARQSQSCCDHATESRGVRTVDVLGVQRVSPMIEPRLYLFELQIFSFFFAALLDVNHRKSIVFPPRNDANAKGGL